MPVDPIRLQKQTGPAECPHCGCAVSHVIRTRIRTVGTGERRRTLRHRRRECDHCGTRFTTRVPDEEVMRGSVASSDLQKSTSPERKAR